LVDSNLASAIVALCICCIILISINFVFFVLQIIPPGVEFGHMIQDFDMVGEEDNPSPASEDPPIWSEVAIFLEICIRNISFTSLHKLFDYNLPLQLIILWLSCIFKSMP
jgi:hypothetical protein